MCQEYTKESKNIELKLIDGTILNGYVNMVGYDRFSEFLENDNSYHLKLYKIKVDKHIGVSYDGYDKDCLIIPKRNIVWHEPL